MHEIDISSKKQFLYNHVIKDSKTPPKNPIPYIKRKIFRSL